MMTLNDMAAVFAAASEGKEIQWAPDLKGPWEFIDNSPRVLVKAASEGNFLRVKPVVRDWWINAYPDEEDAYAYTTKETAEKVRDKSYPGSSIHVREVID